MDSEGERDARALAEFLDDAVLDLRDLYHEHGGRELTPEELLALGDLLEAFFINKGNLPGGDDE
jgi:hypothetical protein